jgi:small-conductance mechanosensitive channel
VGLSDRTVSAIVTAGVGIVLILVVRWALRHLFARYERRALARRSPDEVASLRTRLSVLQRVIVAFLAAIVVWNVLAIFPTTDKLATAVLASSAVLALFVGLAFSAPLGNLGAGILLALTQPIRIGDRVTVEETTGAAEQITLIHTVLLTDDDRRVYIPNSKMVSSTIVNRSVKDARRRVAVELPIGLSKPFERAAPDAKVGVGAGDVRERGVAALAKDDLLPG